MPIKPLSGAILLLASLIAGCAPDAPPPQPSLFAGLPVSGTIEDARRAGFNDCAELEERRPRCQRHGVSLFGQGPFEAAVDFKGPKGVSGFDQVTLWHDTDKRALYKVIEVLDRQGWRYCYTGTESAGDQAVFTREGAPVRFSMDISYYGKRRLRIIPQWNKRELDRPCQPETSLVRFGIADQRKSRN